MPKISAAEYEPLKAFFADWQERFPCPADLPAEHHPLAVLESMEQKSMSQARLGLGLAINDTLEDSWDLSPAEVTAIDQNLAGRGIVTLSELRRRYSRQFKSILKRGKIRDETEYHLVAGILASFSADATDDERMTLNEMVEPYEARSAKK